MQPRLIDRIYKPVIDRHRVARVFRDFDDRAGFRAYCDLCRDAFTRDLGPAADQPLAAQGFEHLPVLNPADAIGWRRRLGDGPLSPTLREPVLSSLLTEAVDARIAGFFASEYLVHWLRFTVTPAAPRPPSVSFRWHCDKGPRTHLKLIVYLDPSADHGGNTDLVSLDDTARLAARGYVFGRTRDRTGDLEALSPIAGHRLTAHRRAVPAGGGIVFQPARVLHRGVAPRHTSRHALILCLLPSAVPWREALQRGAIVDPPRDPKWPRHASELLRSLDLPGH